ncbi:hypothetical protein JCM10207_007534 [Rhodosporidiobolus poonsookiae]
MAAQQPPPSPTKRNILRSIVTGVQPTSPEVHRSRWQRSAGEAPAPLKDTGARYEGQQSGGKVAGLVQGWEASLSAASRSYPSLAPAPSAPGAYGASPTAPARHSQAAPPASNRLPSPLPSSPTSPRGTSPTVPASFFQAQAAKRTSPLPTPSAPSHSRSSTQKENQPRPHSSFRPSPRPASSGLAQARTPDSSTSASGSSSANSDVSLVTTAFTDLTMATRSSDSTHASSLVTNSAEGAHIGVAARVDVGTEDTPRKATGLREPVGLRAPQIVETAPTPQRRQREHAPTPPTRTASPSPIAAAHAQPTHALHGPRPQPYSRPAISPQTSFFEALPPSFPSRSLEPRPLPQQTALPSPTLETNRYKPLPLDNPHDQPAQAPAPKVRGRPRASSLGAELKAAFADEAKPESAEQKKARIEVEFEQLLDTMQLPDRTVRTKMLGLALPLKEEMLRSAVAPALTSSTTLRPPSRPSHQRGRSLNLADSQPPSAVPAPPTSKKEGGSGFKSTFLRKTKSNSSLREKAQKDGSASLSVSTSGSGGGPARRPSSHSRTASATSLLFRSFGKSSSAAAAAQVATLSAGAGADAEDATSWAAKLRATGCAHLEAKELGRLRGRLRTEAPGWVNAFILEGGYLGLLERLKEMLEMEWREEQHDDQVLHELLRCFKGLTMTACGKRALASHSPTPFLPLTALLFSEKRPGDLPCRQLLVELLLSIFDICPPSSDTLPKAAWSTPEISLEPTPSSPSPSGFVSPTEPKGSGGIRRYTRKMKSGDDDDAAAFERDEVLTPERVQQAHRFVVSLMEGPPDEKEEAQVDFIQRAHRPRLFKKWVGEISDCVRDYFWIFCHSNNLFWTLEQIDADAIEAPKVPSGMTGGVEYEAMAYCAAHFRLINAIARTCPTVEAAFHFHNQLFESGFERVLFTLRRASLVYYQSLHLEMSRYISLARAARFNLGARILACLDRRFLSREELMVLQEVERRSQGYHSRSGAPQIGNVF